MDLVVSGLPLYGGRAIICDCTLRSPMSGAGVPRFHADTIEGASFSQARRDKHAKYPELLREDLQRVFLVLACEVGGRCSEECIDFLHCMSRHKSSLQAPALRKSFHLAYHRRWWSILSVAIQRRWQSIYLARNLVQLHCIRSLASKIYSLGPLTSVSAVE